MCEAVVVGKEGLDSCISAKHKEFASESLREVTVLLREQLRRRYSKAKIDNQLITRTRNHNVFLSYIGDTYIGVVVSVSESPFHGLGILEEVKRILTENIRGSETKSGGLIKKSREIEEELVFGDDVGFFAQGEEIGNNRFKEDSFVSFYATYNDFTVDSKSAFSDNFFGDIPLCETISSKSPSFNEIAPRFKRARAPSDSSSTTNFSYRDSEIRDNLPKSGSPSESGISQGGDTSLQINSQEISTPSSINGGEENLFEDNFGEEWETSDSLPAIPESVEIDTRVLQSETLDSIYVNGQLSKMRILGQVGFRFDFSGFHENFSVANLPSFSFFLKGDVHLFSRFASNDKIVTKSLRKENHFLFRFPEQGMFDDGMSGLQSKAIPIFNYELGLKGDSPEELLRLKMDWKRYNDTTWNGCILYAINGKRNMNLEALEFLTTVGGDLRGVMSTPKCEASFNEETNETSLKWKIAALDRESQPGRILIRYKMSPTDDDVTQGDLVSSPLHVRFKTAKSYTNIEVADVFVEDLKIRDEKVPCAVTLTPCARLCTGIYKAEVNVVK